MRRLRITIVILFVEKVKDNDRYIIRIIRDRIHRLQHCESDTFRSYAAGHHV